MKRILCLGDSNTFGYDPRSYFGSRYPADVRWTGLLQSAGWEIVNCGQNGLCIPQKARFPDVRDLLRRAGEPDVIAVMLGSNDLLNGASAGEAASRMAALLDCLKECAGDAKIILIAPPPMQPGDWVPTREPVDESARLGGLYRALAEQRGLAFADAGEWNAALTFDGVHLSPEGHAAFAAGLGRKLEALWE